MATRYEVDAPSDTLNAQVVSNTPPGEASPSGSAGGASACLSDDDILEYRQGQMSAARLRYVDRHVDDCATCREIIDAVIAEEPAPSSTSHIVTTFHHGFCVAGRYQIDRFLGRGGMGEVYAAIDQMTGRAVALKTVLCSAADDARAIRKLLDEVVHAQRVAHPHVFKIYDLHEHVDEARGRIPFFTMELVEGESLGARLRRERQLPVAEVRAIALQLLSGLSAAHQQGVLHLDFKSDNIMLRHNGGDAVIMDFGLSRAFDAGSRQRTSERLQGAGTLPYMSVEQLECRTDLGPASDVYSFGVVLYEMLTGHLPFEGDSFGAVLLKQLRQRPAPLGQHVAVSPQVEAFVLKCLSRAAHQRYADAAQALAALERIQDWTRTGRSRLARRAALVLLLAAPVSAATLAVREVTDAKAPEPEPATATAPAAATAAQASPAAAAGVPEAREIEPAAFPTTEPALPGAVSSAPSAVSSAPSAVPSAPSAVPSRSRAVTSPPSAAPAPRGPRMRALPEDEPAATPVRSADPLRARPSDWRGPPPKHVPKPRPL